MIFETLKPITHSQNQVITLNKKGISKKPILKNKISGIKNSSGRNHSGKITVRHIGGGSNHKYRKINFYRTTDSFGIVCSIEYDPNRNSYIASVFDFLTDTFFYIIAPQNLNIGDIIKAGMEVETCIGNSLPISEIPIGTAIHNISPAVSKKAQISRAAGTFSILKQKTEEHAIIEISSGELRRISPKCFATIGEVSNELDSFRKLGKAGHSRWLNRRPTVRGVAMNPVDHPHGGGEGKKSGKNLTPWGKPNNKGKTGNSRNKYIVSKFK
jgi:large subunit ribosomal protein L2